MADPVDIDTVVADEQDEVRERRNKAGLTAQDVEDNLVGLALSGGAMRSASFSLGFVQALQRLGVWKFIDYLSTVSGGGYIGSYLTSSTLYYRKSPSKEFQPLNEPSSYKQPTRVLRFIYGGRFLLSPWRLANSYLIGLVAMNVAILSGAMAVCSILALLWRSFDLPVIKDRMELLFAASDYQRAFWPFYFFTVAWMIAWLISRFQRSNDAEGTVARYLLVVTIGSFLVGVAILVGSGDVSGLSELVQGKQRSIWSAALALIVGGLLPFLSPKRLLKSGFAPEHPWERYVFRLASTCLLVGLPLVIIGTIGRENISQFNTDPYREFVPGDIESVDRLCEQLTEAGALASNESLVDRLGFLYTADPRIDSPMSSIPNFEQAMELTRDRKLELMKPELQEIRSNLRTLENDNNNRNTAVGELQDQDERNSAAKSSDEVSTKKNDAEVKSSTDEQKKRATEMDRLSKEVDAIREMRGVLDLLREPTIQPEIETRQEKIKKLLAQVAVLSSDLASSPSATNVKSPLEDWSKKLGRLATEHQETIIKYQELYLRLNDAKAHGLGNLEDLQSIAKEAGTDDVFSIADTSNDGSIPQPLQRVVSELKDARADYAIAKSKYFRIGEPDRYDVTTYFRCLTEYLSFWQDDDASRYWKYKTESDRLTQQVCDRLNQIVADGDFLETQIGYADRSKKLAGAAETNSETGQTDAVSEPLKTPVPTTDIHRLASYEIRLQNRLLLEQEFPDIFRTRDQVKRVVSIHSDQRARLRWLFWSLGVFLVAGMWMDMNGISPHRYYRDRVAKSFLIGRRGKSPSIALSELNTAEFGGPYHLISATVSITPKQVQLNELMGPDTEGLDQRSVDTFLFSQRYCGSEVTQYAETTSYEHSVVGYASRLDLAEATAISGAALSAGHQRNWLLSFLILAFNLSMGQWVPNPSAPPPRFRPRVIGLLASLWKKPAERPYCYVSDGGHAENTGLVQLLKRRCKLIFVADASYDPEHHFHDLGRAFRMARIHDGVQFLSLKKDVNGHDQEFDLRDLRLNADGNCEKHFTMARICYPKKEREGQDTLPAAEGLLVYFKPCFTGDESLDLKQFRDLNNGFPHESTSDQLFDSDQVESYRYLGYHAGMQLHNLFPPEMRVGELWDYGPNVGAEHLIDWFKSDHHLTPGVPRPVGIGNPVEATQAEIRQTRPLAKKLIGKMRDHFSEPADILSLKFRQIVEEDEEFKDANITQAVTAVQCAVLDKVHPVPDREYCVWLLDAVEADREIPTNVDETIQLLYEVIKPAHPERLRQAAISLLAILGRAKRFRKEAIRRLEEVQESEKSLPKSLAATRLAIKNALSNLRDSPTKPR